MKKQSSDLVTEAEFFFPEEIVSEILSWLAVKYLTRYKSVCKLWYAIINSKQFADMHAKHDGCRSFCYINSESFDFNSEIEKIRLECTPVGFCLVERLSFTASDNMPSAATYRIINPSTKRVLDLPHDPNKRVHSMTLFQNSSTNSYYVFSIYIDEKAEPKYELLDLGGQSNDPCPNENLSWKTFSISEIAKILLGRQHIVLFLENKDILYFLVLGMVGLSNPKIICFDLVKQQTCTTLKVPDQSLFLNSTNVRFSNWRGNPAVSFVLEEKVNIWVLEDYKKQKWADMIQIPLPFTKEYSSWNEPDSYKYCNDREILLRYGMELPCWIYVPELKQWCKIPSLPRRTPATLVSVKGMQPAGEEKRTTKRRGSIFGLGGLLSWFNSLYYMYY